MYKVFINEKVIWFTNKLDSCKPFENGLVLNFFTGNITPFMLELLSKSEKTRVVIVVVADVDSAFLQFQAQFKLISAAGGIVSNSKSEKLFIYRLDKWDLPKGKVEKGEGIREAALREVEEECGIDQLTLLEELPETYHIYHHKDQFILKRTYWFNMFSSYEGELIPQLEENITKVEWLTNIEVNEKVLGNTYPSILDLMKVTGS